ncbi:MAG TPA: T9SS type A sorting domain-containing protein, partial [Chitinophagaceae bacterium]|nr:T9SS type A sorting domain-containing protein [Chitinophagaceae bacterium]
LMGMLRPGVHYDDLIICNGQGVYKNGISKLQQQLLDIANAQHEKLLEDKGVLVYPNPTHAQITIEYLIERNERLDIVIYDLVGNKLKSEQLKFNSNKSSIDLNGFSTGMYFYQIKSSLGKIYSGKLIIE